MPATCLSKCPYALVYANPHRRTPKSRPLLRCVHDGELGNGAASVIFTHEERSGDVGASAASVRSSAERATGEGDHDTAWCRQCSISSIITNTLLQLVYYLTIMACLGAVGGWAVQLHFEVGKAENRKALALCCSDQLTVGNGTIAATELSSSRCCSQRRAEPENNTASVGKFDWAA